VGLWLLCCCGCFVGCVVVGEFVLVVVLDGVTCLEVLVLCL